MKLLTMLLVIVLLNSVAIDGYCAYDLLGGRVQSERGSSKAKEADLTEDEQQALEEAEALEKQRQERIEQGEIVFSADMLMGMEDQIVSNDDSATAFLENMRDELGVEDAAYRFENSQEFKSFNYYTLQQLCNDIPVYGSCLTIQTDKFGNVVNVTGQHTPVDDVDTEMILDEGEVLEKAKSYARMTYQLDDKNCSVRNNGTRVFPLATGEIVVGYEIEVLVDDIPYRTIAVDGNSGAVIAELTNIFYDNPESKMLPRQLIGQEGSRVLDVWYEADDTGMLIDKTRNIEIYLSDRTKQNESVSDIRNRDIVTWKWKEEQPDRSAVDALANLQKVYDFYYDLFGFQGVCNDPAVPLPVYVGVNILDGHNVFENAGMIGRYMAVGRRASGYEFSVGLDIMGHEYTHGITGTLAPAFCTRIYSIDEKENEDKRQKSAPYGINEGLADVFGEFIDDYCNDENKKPDERLNGNCDWLHNIYSSGMRDLMLPASYSDFKEFHTDCHDSASLVSYPIYLMAYKIANEGDPIEEDGPAIKIETLANLCFSLIPSFTQNTDFKAFRQIFETNAALFRAAHYGNGNPAIEGTLTDVQLETVIDSFDQVGIPSLFENRVVTNGKLKVYGKDNHLYDNYNLKVYRFGDPSSAVLDSDVHEKQYKIPASLPNGIYEAELTDLADPSGKEFFTFVINDNAEDQQVKNYPKELKIHTKFGSVPREVVLMLDASSSMNGTPVEQTREAARKFVNTVLSESPSTRISVIEYADSAEVLQESVNEKGILYSAIDDLRSSGGTNIYDAMQAGKDILKKSDAPTKIMILMSDGAPNRGTCDSWSDYESPVRRLAKKIKNDDNLIYTLGFYHNLGESELRTCQMLMSDIASPGYAYTVTDADDLEYHMFDDMANVINGINYVNIRIACPVDVTVTFDGETLSSDSKNQCTHTSFGALSFEQGEVDEESSDSEDLDGQDGSEDLVKILRLEDSRDYEICINGTGIGMMDYTISYPNEDGEYTDIRTFSNIPITKNTLISTSSAQTRRTEMVVDNDGDGRTDRIYTAGKGKEAKVSSKNKTLLSAMLAVDALLLLWFLFRKFRNHVAGRENVGVCPRCGNVIEKNAKFCVYCGMRIADEPRVYKQSRGSAIAKLVMIALAAGFTALVVFVYCSSPSNVYRQLRENNFVSASSIYNNHVQDTHISKKYLSLITDSYLNRAWAAYEDGALLQEDYRGLLECVSGFDLGDASERADKMLELSDAENGVEDET